MYEGISAMIKILFNGKEKDISSRMTLNELIEQLSYVPGTFAVAVNEVFIHRGEYTKTIIQAGDRIEIVMPMQGG
jgi:sulfur carrier protein